MGRSVKPPYRIEVDGQKMCWSGRANQKTLEAYIASYAKSLQIGGANEHITRALGRIPYPNRARLVRQATGEVVAEWRAAMFQVW